jgi:peptidyl-prolyl cis-trans isomerase D
MRISTDTFASASPKSIITGVLAALAVVAFAVTGFGGQLGKNFDSNVAAHVGKQQVSIRTLNEVVQEYDRQQGDRGDAERRRANIQNALNQLIQEKLFIEEANRLGWSATDLEVAHWIRSVPAFQDEKTKVFRAELYQRFLKSGRMTELELFNNGRESVARSKMQALLALPIKTPEKLLEEKYLIENTKFEVEYLEVKPAAAALSSAILDAATKYASEAANAKALQDAYAAAKDEFDHKAQIKLRGILIGWKEAQRAQGEALKRSKDQAKTLAQTLRERIAGGAKFAQLASENNDDAMAKSKMGDLGWVDDTSIDPETFAAAKKLQGASATPNAISDVIETAFGYRIVQLTETRPEVKRTFNDVKEELAKRAVQSEITNKLTSEVESTVTKALTDNNNASLNSVISSQGLAWKKLAKPLTAKDRFVEGLGLADSLTAALFRLKNPQDMTHELIKISSRSFVFRLLGRQAPTAPTREQLTEAANMERGQFSRNFQTDAQRKLFEIYTKNGDIKHNPALNQF